MTTTLLRIKDRLGDPKVIVWAHNSHIGDSTATNRGGMGFEKNETWNLGQMTRATFGADLVWIVGQYTHSGTVTAASDWGQPHADVALRPALADCYEGQLHAMHARFGAGRVWSINTAAVLARVASMTAVQPAAAAVASAFTVAEHPAAEGLIELLQGPPRLQRWVGVSYKPATERESHYGEMNLARCYDQVIYFDTTTALRPVASRPQPSGAGGVVTRASTQRLLKEFSRIARAPPPGIEARPLESGTCFFLLLFSHMLCFSHLICDFSLSLPLSFFPSLNHVVVIPLVAAEVARHRSIGVVFCAALHTAAI
jgi:hypothetical protein